MQPGLCISALPRTCRVTRNPLTKAKICDVRTEVAQHFYAIILSEAILRYSSAPSLPDSR